MEQATNSAFPIAWKNIALCVIQLARGKDAWVIDITRVKAYPQELKRVLESDDVMKVGVALITDIPSMWGDLRSDVKNMVDVGLMTKLVLADKYNTTAYGPVGLQDCVADILGFHVDKGPQKSDWKQVLTDAQIKYAAIDAVASIRLYDALVPRLVELENQIKREIPDRWYRYNSSFGNR
ncbi:ribonuclease H-like domain-containing protein [Mycena rebaudengoi]|nr:ribonuclease H-like domain-containing protein [Mycena rebaudengoi]